MVPERRRHEEALSPRGDRGGGGIMACCSATPSRNAFPGKRRPAATSSEPARRTAAVANRAEDAEPGAAHAPTEQADVESPAAAAGTPRRARSRRLRLERAAHWAAARTGDATPAAATAAVAVHCQAGHRLYAAGEYAAAAAELALAIRHGHPAHAECHNTRGASLAALERYDDAVASFTCALEHDPGMYTAWSNRGQAHMMRGDLAAAVADLKQATLLHPSEENVQLLGDAEAELVNPAAASSFQQALLHFASAEWAEARGKFEAALRMDDLRATRCHNGIGICHFVEGAPEPALAALSRATEVDPNNASAWHNCAKALSKLVSN